MRVALLAVDTRWEEPSIYFASFSYAARKLEASIRGAPDLAHVETQVIDLKTDDPDAFFEAIRDFEPTLVAASTYIWSVAPPRAFAPALFAPSTSIWPAPPSSESPAG